MLRVGVVGLGNAGGQVAKLVSELTPFPVFAINSSEDDLATLGEKVPTVCIGDKEGSAKRRSDAKKFLQGSIVELSRNEKFLNFMQELEAVCIVSSTGGGTGSGTLPIMTKFIASTFKTEDSDGTRMPIITVPIGIMQKRSEAKSTQVNSLAFLHELWDILGGTTYFLFDNDKYSKLPSYQALEKVNESIVKVIEVIAMKYNVATPYDSIDPKEMKETFRTPGRSFVAILDDIKEKDIDNTSIEDMLIEQIKNSDQVELQRDGVVYTTAVISNLSPKLNSTFNNNLPKIREFIGEPVDEFVHTVVNKDKGMPNSVVLILTGLSNPVDRVEKIRERIAEIDARTAEIDRQESVISADEINKFEQDRASRNNAESSADGTNLKDLFDKFK